MVFNHIDDVLNCVENGQSDYALIPVYNTREGEIKEYFRVMAELDQNFWVDNIVMPIHLSLGGISGDQRLGDVEIIIGRASVLKQCEEYISAHMSKSTRVSAVDIESTAKQYLSDTAENRRHPTGVGPVGMGDSQALAGEVGEGRILVFGDSNGL